jgi:protein SCO1
MKTTLALLAAALGAASPLFGSAPAPCCPAPEQAAKSGCCAADTKPAPASCCAAEAPDVALTDRSVYQLDAAWTNDRGETVKLASLRGRPVVLAMFFAQCEYACPVLVHDIRRLRAALPEELRDRAQLVLVTFDVARDTVAALHAYRARMELDPQWTLLRGDAGAVQELAMLLGVKFKQDARGQFSHSNLFTILNQEGEIVHQHVGLKGDITAAAKVTAALTSRK